MAENFITNQHEGLTYSGIVHTLLNKITTELAVKEFRGGYKKPVILAGTPFMDYVPDSRAEYIQAVETLLDILLPRFDEEMEEYHSKYKEELKELEEKLDGKEVIMGDDNHKSFIRSKVKLTRKLFQELNLLLDRKKYLKTEPHIEDAIEVPEE